MSMSIKSVVEMYFSVLFFLCVCLHSSSATAQLLATFEIGDAVLPAYTTAAAEATPFTTITFDGVFASPPNVFTITPQFGADPCLIRIDNVTTTGFDATCLEPISEDRDNPGTIFEYIAIADGGVTVPLSSGTGDVVFQSACSDITTQQFGNRCPECGGVESFTPITFPAAFTTMPAVLAQLQTTNNNNANAAAPATEPAFLDAAIGDDPATSITTTGFNLAIERMEAGEIDVLTQSENICYLAAEVTSTCQSLDFSSIGGPTTPVMFQSLIGLQNVAGQETSGSTTNFATGCFTNTPIALAKSITRNGGDGSFVRRFSISNTGITLIIDEDTVGDPERNHGGVEQPGIFAFSEAFTTPVTLNSAQVSLLGRQASFKWETSAETFHLGFNLWGESSDGWVQLNRRLIASNGVDTDEIQTYNRGVRLTRRQANEITNFGISSVDSTGYEEFYGPFTEGQSYGEEANNEPVDWTDTRDSFEQSMRDRGFVKVNNRWRRLSSSAQALVTKNELGVNQAMFEIQVSASGIHSINASELIALNPNWNRKALRNVALTLNGNAVPRHIISGNRRLDNNDQIIFNAQTPQGADTPFLEHYTYRLSLDRSNAIDANTFDGTLADNFTESQATSLATSALLEQTITSKKLHSSGLTNGDPWYDARLLSTGRTVSVEYKVDFDHPIDINQEGQLDVLLFGSLDFPGEGDDHHVQIYINDQQISDLSFDGLVGQQLLLTIEAGLLTQTGNTVRVDVVGDTGFFADVVLVDEITIAAFSALSNESRPVLDFADLGNANGYQVSSQTPDESQVYAYTSTGLLSSVSTTKGDGIIGFASLPFENSSNSESTLRYAVGSADTWARPVDISLVTGQDLHSQENDYLIVAHPTFMGEALDDFVTFKTELGFNVRVVDWLEVVNTYGYGNNTPSALDNFLSAANQLYTTENILIVGGHTYDYFGITDDNIVNFIPSHYRPVSVFEYTATDNPYADLDGDNVPEVAIGRWPVRSITDLQTIIKKTKDWHQNREDNPYQDAYLLAQATDGQSLDFTEQLGGRVKSPLSLLDEIDNISILSLDNLPEEAVSVVGFARSELAEQINNGTDLISFSGHGSPTAWGFQNIINTGFIQGLENQGEPVLLMPLACYITHYESVSTNTLAHQWLFAGDIGAAAIHGASVLGEYRENGLFAERYINQSKESQTVGQAILKAKQALGSNNEILHNWILLGDPALPIR